MTRLRIGIIFLVIFALPCLTGCREDSSAEVRIRELQVAASGATLHARIAGEPETGSVLVAIHGGPGNCSDYMIGLEELAGAELAVVTYDQRGTGQSLEPVDGYAMTRYIEDLDAVRVAVDAERVHLLGHSWGGVVALQYAAAHPERVRSIILMGSGPMTPEAVTAGQTSLSARIASLQNEGLIPSTPSVVPDLLPAYFSDPEFEPPSELAAMFYEPEVQRETWAALEGYDHAAGLDLIACPVLLVYGEDDPFGRGLSEAAHEALTQARLKTLFLEDCGHYWHEAPGPFFDAVRAFLTPPR